MASVPSRAIRRRPKRKAPVVCSVAPGWQTRWNRWRITGVPHGRRRETNAAAVGTRKQGLNQSQRSPHATWLTTSARVSRRNRERALVETAFTRFPGMTPGQPFAHHLRRTHLLTSLTAQGMAQCVIIRPLLSAHGHGSASLLLRDEASGCVFVSQKKRRSLRRVLIRSKTFSVHALLTSIGERTNTGAEDHPEPKAASYHSFWQEGQKSEAAW